MEHYPDLVLTKMLIDCLSKIRKIKDYFARHRSGSRSMRILIMMSNSLGYFASGKRLVSIVKDIDLPKAKVSMNYSLRLALNYSPRLALNYSPRLALNYCGQMALMQTCQYGHWQVVQTLILYKANVLEVDYFHGGIALNFVALADGGITDLNLGEVNGQPATIQLLDLRAYVTVFRVEDKTTIALIGARDTPLYYVADGENVLWCLVISSGINLTTKYAIKWTPVAHSIKSERTDIEGITLVVVSYIVAINGLARGSHTLGNVQFFKVLLDGLPPVDCNYILFILVPNLTDLYKWRFTAVDTKFFMLSFLLGAHNFWRSCKGLKKNGGETISAFMIHNTHFREWD